MRYQGFTKVPHKKTALDVRRSERHARDVVPTGYGEMLFRHIRPALSELGLAYEGILALRSPVAWQVARQLAPKRERKSGL
jgi:DNA-binding transcriptional LysR family regulator